MRIYDMTKWDTFAYFVLTSLMLWIGDVLVIYRTYIVWSKNIRVVALPILIHVTYVVIGTITIHAFSQPHKIPLKTAIAWSLPVFPLVVAQNLITTGLLSYKIYSTHRESMRNGVTDATSGKLSLVSLAWMLIETAMLYTLNLLVLIILSVLRHPAHVIASILLVPNLVAFQGVLSTRFLTRYKSSGIVFVLLSVRVHLSGTTRLPDEAASKSANVFEFRRPDSNDRNVVAHPLASQSTVLAHVTHEQELHDDYSTTQRSNIDTNDAEAEDRHSESFPTGTISLARRNSREWL
ncbi:hypothetical protein BJ165DRAFT_1580775 [Panaeolus papilionaceus]|nr:hypothetical protein BJ165DRAFT_1580775 [Panaeolus papilionaceus]